MHRKLWRRKGALTVEFAITAGLLFFIVFAALEFSRINMLQNTAGIAAYQGARRGLVPGATREKVEQIANKWLDDIGTKDAVITIVPEVITDETPEVSVAVEIPLQANAWTAPIFRPGMIIRSECTLRRERIIVE